MKKKLAVEDWVGIVLGFGFTILAILTWLYADRLHGVGSVLAGFGLFCFAAVREAKAIMGLALIIVLTGVGMFLHALYTV